MDQKLERVFRLSFASVYPLYVQKAEKKGRTKQEVDRVLRWLTGYTAPQLKRVSSGDATLEAFFAGAPKLNPKAKQVMGVVCGVRVEDVADPLMRKIRVMDKLIDELAKGKAMEVILREG